MTGHLDFLEHRGSANTGEPVSALSPEVRRETAAAGGRAPRTFQDHGEIEDLEWLVHDAGGPAGGFGDVAASEQVVRANGEVCSAAMISDLPYEVCPENKVTTELASR
jgi:hypothetical protein